MQVNRFVAGLIFILAATAGGVCLIHQWRAGENEVGERESVGRYHLISVKGRSPGWNAGSSDSVIKIDSVTGTVWELFSYKVGDVAIEAWTELGSERSRELVDDALSERASRSQ